MSAVDGDNNKVITVSDSNSSTVKITYMFHIEYHDGTEFYKIKEEIPTKLKECTDCCGYVMKITTLESIKEELVDKNNILDMFMINSVAITTSGRDQKIAENKEYTRHQGHWPMDWYCPADSYIRLISINGSTDINGYIGTLLDERYDRELAAEEKRLQDEKQYKLATQFVMRRSKH